VRFIRFRRNFGKSDALHAGFAAARGEVIFTMDADLQDDPKEIPRFLELLETGGWDLVSGWKKVRHDPLSKTLPSRLFNRVTSAASGVRLHDFNCGFKCYRRAVVQALEVYGELHRFLPALAHMKGFRVTEMVVEHHARRFGSSKFGLSRFINGFLDLLTVVFTARYLKKPMHFFGPVSLVITGSGLVINGWLAFAKLVLGQPINGRPLLFLGMLLLIVGVQLLSLGLLGEMLTRQQKSVEYQVLEHSPDPDEPPAAGARAL
jgi:glycosyltransferase involved in cell wall biosynthesis